MEDMRYDLELLRDFADERFCRKQICEWCDVSQETLSQYINGGRNIPTSLWRGIFRATRDLRILLLITRDVPIEVVPLIPACDLPSTSTEVFKTAIEDFGKYTETQNYIAQLLGDGRVDELDGDTVQRYADAFTEHRRTSAILNRAIVTIYNRAVAAKANKETR